jgi:uncharacterized protein YjiS (DUF1127 family)
MAHATHTTHAPLLGNGLGAAFRAVLARMADSRKRDRAYRKTYRELDQMTDRDLADIGITRFMIADVAAEAAARA